ncbi:MAG: N-acetylmuramoyl-L-alanine amidase [Rhodobacteraceae bacterium]|nr:N-acetylmuramoyl-L-alanine amidase [Paracoccaceae bacterium]
MLAVGLLLAATAQAAAQGGTVAGPGNGLGSGLGAHARVDPGAVVLRSDHGALALRLPLSMPVPWRARVLGSPPRLVLDLNTVDWRDLSPEGLRPGWGPAVRDLRLGRGADGWARLVIDLAGPYRLEQATLERAEATGAAMLRLDRRRAPGPALAASALDDAAFGARHGVALRHPYPPPPPGARAAGRPLVVVLDPGHGGADPGAEAGGLRESDLMLGFARELRDALVRAGGFEVVLTRDADVFVSLHGRIRAARAANADVFLSLHADALPDGLAAGATIYSLSEDASDRSAAILAERHDRTDLLAGVDLSRAEDAIADVLMSMAQRENRPRTDALADSLIGAIRDQGLRLHRRPHQSGAFSVLRAPDVPSLLIELGFMSNPRDLERLQDPAWRRDMQAAIVAGLRAWAEADAAEAPLRRR